VLQQQGKERCGDLFRRYKLLQVFLKVMFRALIVNKVKILISSLVEINDFSLLNDKRFSLLLHNNYKTSTT
jgi:hypothetical protein